MQQKTLENQTNLGLNKALVEVPGICVDCFMPLVILGRGFSTMDVNKRTRENQTNILRGLRIDLLCEPEAS